MTGQPLSTERLREILRAYYLSPPPRPTQEELAATHHLHPQTVASILRGRRCSGRPHRRALEAMAAEGLAVGDDGKVISVLLAEEAP